MFDPREPPPPPQHDMPTDNELQVLDAQEVLERLAARIGWKRVATLARNLAHINGEQV